MRPAWRLACNTLAGRRGRTALMVAAVALAASLVVAVSSAIGSAQATIEYRLLRFLGASDVRVVHPSGGRFDAALLDVVRAWPDVDAATGRTEGSITLRRADGAVDPESNRPRRATPRVIGVDLELEPSFRTLDLEAGVWPTAPNEVLLDPQTAGALDADVGSELTIERFGPPITLRVSGIYERKRLGALQTPRIYMAHATLAEATGVRDRFSTIYVILEDGVDNEAFCAAHAEDIPAPLSLEPAEMVRAGFDRRVRASRIGLVAASALAFLCAAFIIVTGMTTAVTEKERELGLLRAIGASRSQIFLSQLLVGVLFGVIGAGLGTPLGLGLARALVWYYRDYLPGGFHVQGLGVMLTVIGSLVSGLIGALYPAWFASRITPLRVLTQRGRPIQRRHIVTITGAALGLLALHLLLLLPGDTETQFWNYIAVGLPALFTGWFLLGVPLLYVVTRIVAPLLTAVLRLPADVLSGSVLATPFRHGLTSGALMVGMALLVNSWSAGLALQRDWLHQVRFADGFAFKTTGIEAAEREAIAALPFVESVSAIGRLPVRLSDQQVFGLTGITSRSVICISFEPERFFELNSIDWIEGDPETALPKLKDGSGLLVAERFLNAKGLGVGDSITLEVGKHAQAFEILGVVSSAGLDLATPMFGIGNQYMELSISCVFIDRTAVAELWDVHATHILQVDLADSISDADAERAINDAAPGVIFRSGRMILGALQEIANTSLAIQSTIALAALILASIAVGNVIAANIQARRFEYGVLRAVGATRWVVTRLILGEAVVFAVTGAVLGTGFGFVLAWMDARNLAALAGLPVGVALPLLPIAIGWGIQITITVIAALPACIGLARRTPAELL